MPYETFLGMGFLIKVEYGYRDYWGKLHLPLEI